MWSSSLDSPGPQRGCALTDADRRGPGAFHAFYSTGSFPHPATASPIVPRQLRTRGQAPRAGHGATVKHPPGLELARRSSCLVFRRRRSCRIRLRTCAPVSSWSAGAPICQWRACRPLTCSPQIWRSLVRTTLTDHHTLVRFLRSLGQIHYSLLVTLVEICSPTCLKLLLILLSM